MPKSSYTLILRRAMENENQLLQFLNTGGNVNQKDEQGNTLLLLASCTTKDEFVRKSDLVGILLNHGADVNARNIAGHTPLYCAILYKNAEAVRILLAAGADIIFQRETALHLVAENGHEEMLNLLLTDKKCTADIINGKDANSWTPAYRAALSDNRETLKILILHGGDLSFTPKPKDQPDLMSVIFEEISKPAEFLIELLDEKIYVQSQNNKNKYIAELSVLAPAKCERQMEVISKLIEAASVEEEKVVLQHPLIELLLILKWNKLCYFYYYLIVMFGIYVFSMSGYVMLVNKFLSTNCHNCHHFYKYMMIARVVTILSAFCILLHLGLKGILAPNKLLRFEQLVNMSLLVLSIAVAILGIDHSYMPVSGSSPNWILHTLSIIVLFAWIEMMSLFGKLPSLGYYATMFTTVLKNVLKVLSVFICLLIGFALSFSIQFRNYEQFSDPWRALVKTMVMMMGEFEYADLFASSDTSSFAHVVSRFIFLMFIILTSIVLMNLMIALAASDIQSLQTESHAKKMKKQAQFLVHMEKVLFSKPLQWKRMPSIFKRFLRSRKYVRTIYEINKQIEKSKHLPVRLVDAIKAIAKEKRHHHH